MSLSDLLAEWSGDLDDFFDEFGEQVTWTPAGGDDVVVAAIIDRAQKGRADWGRGEARQELGRITIRLSDVPTAADGDTAEIPVSPGSETTQTVAIGERIDDVGNGTVVFALQTVSERRFTDGRV